MSTEASRPITRQARSQKTLSFFHCFLLVLKWACMPTLVTGWCLSTTTEAMGGCMVGDDDRPAVRPESCPLPVALVTSRGFCEADVDADTCLADAWQEEAGNSVSTSCGHSTVPYTQNVCSLSQWLKCCMSVLLVYSLSLSLICRLSVT